MASCFNPVSNVPRGQPASCIRGTRWPLASPSLIPEPHYLSSIISQTLNLSCTSTHNLSILGEPTPKLSPLRQLGPLPEQIASLSLLPVSAAVLVSLVSLQADWKEVPMGLSRMWQAQ